MKRTNTFIFLLLICFSTKSSAQSYVQRHAKCTQIIKDSALSLDLLDKINECLKGTTAPNFIATTIDSNKIELSKLKGYVVVLNFWNIRCKPCIEEMPELNKLVKSYTGKNVKFISLAPENRTTLNQFFKKHPFDFINISDARDIRVQDFKLEAIFPYTVVIDKQGKIKKMWFGTGGENETLVNRYQKIINECL